jgi:hypothetical protein
MNPRHTHTHRICFRLGRIDLHAIVLLRSSLPQLRSIAAIIRCALSTVEQLVFFVHTGVICLRNEVLMLQRELNLGPGMLEAKRNTSVLDQSVEVELSDYQLNFLDELLDKDFAHTRSDAIRRAISILWMIVDHVHSGWSIGYVGKNEKFHALELELSRSSNDPLGLVARSFESEWSPAPERIAFDDGRSIVHIPSEENRGYGFHAPDDDWTMVSEGYLKPTEHRTSAAGLTSMKTTCAGVRVLLGFARPARSKKDYGVVLSAIRAYIAGATDLTVLCARQEMSERVERVFKSFAEGPDFDLPSDVRVQYCDFKEVFDKGSFVALDAFSGGPTLMAWSLSRHHGEVLISGPDEELKATLSKYMVHCHASEGLQAVENVFTVGRRLWENSAGPNRTHPK